MDFEKKIESICKQKKNRVGIGITKPTPELVKYIKKISGLVDVVVFGANVEGLERVTTSDIEMDMTHALKDGKIGGIVRGQADAFKMKESMSKVFGYAKDQIIHPAIVQDLKGKLFVLCPVSNPQGWTVEQKVKLIDESLALMKMFDIPVKMGVLTSVRPGSLGRNSFLDDTYKQADEITALYSKRFEIKNYNIEIETAMRDNCTLIIEPNGATGNQVLRVLMFLAGMKVWVPMAGINETVVEIFRTSDDFSQHILFCSALINLKSK